MLPLIFACLLAHADDVVPPEPILTVDVAAHDKLERARKTSQIGQATFATGAAILTVSGVAAAVNLAQPSTLVLDDGSETANVGAGFRLVSLFGASMVGASVALAGGITWAVGDSRRRHLSAVVTPYSTGAETGLMMSGRF